MNQRMSLASVFALVLSIASAQILAGQMEGHGMMPSMGGKSGMGMGMGMGMMDKMMGGMSSMDMNEMKSMMDKMMAMPPAERKKAMRKMSGTDTHPDPADPGKMSGDM